MEWENLKKSARKRCAGGKDYFPPDEVLDQIATLLGNTCTGFTVEFGGDAVEIDSVMDLIAQNVEKMTKDYVVVDRDGVIGGGGVGVSGDGISVGVSCGGSDSAQREVLKEKKIPTPTSEKKSFYFVKASGSGSLAKRKFKLEEEITIACVQRENALTEYLLAKKKKTDVEMEEKQLNVAKLQLELENAKLALENSRLENLKLKKDLDLLS